MPLSGILLILTFVTGSNKQLPHVYTYLKKHIAHISTKREIISHM